MIEDELDGDGDTHGISNLAYASDSSSGDEIQNTSVAVTSSQFVDSDEDTYNTVVAATAPQPQYEWMTPEELPTIVETVTVARETVVKQPPPEQFQPDIEVKLGFREGKVKIVQIRANEIVQGILQLEPHFKVILISRVSVLVGLAPNCTGGNPVGLRFLCMKSGQPIIFSWFFGTLTKFSVILIFVCNI